jgi:superfamily I DNA/RNA helicase
MTHRPQLGFVMRLNPEQIQYIEEIDRCCTTISIPGSGKSTVAIAKIVKIFEAKPLAKVIAVTFTAAAAAELVEKANKEIPEDRRNDYRAATFHSLAIAHLNAHGHLIGYHKPRILNGMQRDRYVTEAAKMIGHDDAKGNPVELIDSALARLPKQWTSLEVGLVKSYRDILRRNKATDFGVILQDLVVSMANGKLPLLEVNHMIVDEAQDVDRVQLEFALLHARGGAIVDLIGDDDQSIYGFKCGLGYRAISEFTNQTGARVIMFRENFRSRQTILDAAKTVIETVSSDRRLLKELYATRGLGGVVELRKFIDRAYEVHWVADAIKAVMYQESSARRIDPETGKPITVAVLAKNHATLDLVEAACKLQQDFYGIQRKRGQRIWDKEPLTIFTGLLRTLAIADDVVGLDQALSWAGVSVDEREILRTGGRSQKYVLGRNLTSNLVLGEVARRTIAELNEEWMDWCAMANSKDAETVEQLLAAVAAWLQRNKMPKATGAQQEWYDNVFGIGIKVLSRLHGSLKERLAFLDKAPSQFDTDNCAQLMTLHSSKGLQFNTTFIVALEDDVIPGDHGMEVGLLEEDVRLLYVGMTRARDRLVLTYRTKKFHFGYWKGDRYEVVRKDMSLSRFLLDIETKYSC